MVSKLNSSGQGGSGSNGGFAISIQEPKRRHRALKAALTRLSIEEIVAALGPLIKKVVKEEIERAIIRVFHPSPRSIQNSIGSSGTSSLHLNFVNKLPRRIFTNSKLQAENNLPLQIELVDSRSMSRITSGHLSSLKLEIFVINGDFAADEESEWTENDLNHYKMRARENRRPLLAGDLVVTLVNGVGSIGDISLTDNSSWTRTGKFRLVARAKQRSNTDSIRIREAITNLYEVKDHRGETSQKHHPPSLSDDVWRLEKIGRNGKFHSRLASRGINSVRDFLQLFAVNPTELRNIIGGVSDNMWEKITEHAKSCILNDSALYMYNSCSQVLELNAVYEPVRVSFDGQNFQGLDNLSPFQKNLVENLKRRAYENIDQLSIVQEPSTLDSQWPLNREADRSVNPSLASQIYHLPINFQGKDLQELEINYYTASKGKISSFEFMHYREYVSDVNACADAGQQELGSGLNHSALLPPYEIASQMEVPEAQAMHDLNPVLSSSFLIRNFSFGTPPVMDHSSSLDDISFVQPSWSYSYPLGMNDSFGASSSETLFGMLSSHPTHGFYIATDVKSSPKAGWCKIRAAVKWKILARQVVAARRMALLAHLGHFF